MTILIGNAPCSWGVEFANDERNPAWTTVLDECAEAGYRGIELGPVGFMPEDPDVLGPALESRNLALIGGVVFRAFHDPEKWEDTLDGSVRTCKALKAHGAKHLVLIDSISDRRAPTAGRPEEAEQMDDAEWAGFVERIRTIARMGTEEYGLTVAIHAHAAGFCDFRPELESLLNEVDESVPFRIIHLLCFFRTSRGGCTTVRDRIDQDQVFCSVGFEGLTGSNRTVQGVFPFFRIMKGTEHHPADQGQVS